MYIESMCLCVYVQHPRGFALHSAVTKTNTNREGDLSSSVISDRRALAPPAKFHGHFGLFQLSDRGIVANTFQFHCHRQSIPEARETLDISNSLLA